MKYVYGTLAVVALMIGLVLWYSQGLAVEALLTFIFGAVCAVAAEVSELGEKFTVPEASGPLSAATGAKQSVVRGVGPSGESLGKQSIRPVFGKQCSVTTRV